MARLNIRPNCDCGASLTVEASDSATLVCKRKCRRCHERWQIVVKPLAIAKLKGAAHMVSMARVVEKE